MKNLRLSGVRVPLWLSGILMTAVITGVWYFGTRAQTFMTPISVANRQRLEKRFDAEFPRTVNNDFTHLYKPIVESKKNGFSVLTKEDTLPLDHLDEKPELQSYRAWIISKPCSLLMLFASSLEKLDKPEHALLVYERIIDSSTPTDVQRNFAVNSIKRLRPLVSKKDVAPAQKFQLLLHVSTKKSHEVAIRSAAEKLVKELEKASFGKCLIKPRIQILEGTNPAGSKSNIQVWLSGENDLEKCTETALVNISSKKEATKVLTRAVYLVLQQEAKKWFLEPKALSNKDELEGVFEQNLTRGVWQAIAQSLCPSSPAIE